MLVVVAGALANKAGKGGEAWVRLSYVAGLARLGHEVRFLEEIAEPDPLAVAYFAEVADGFGLEGAALVSPLGEVVRGPDAEELLDLAERADLLLNVSGNLSWPAFVNRVARRAYLDIDPGFTQFWHAEGVLAGLDRHDVHFTIGANVGRPECTIPTDGIRWLPTRPPAVLEGWPVSAGAPDRFTTVATWRGAFGPVEHAGKRYGLKVHEFRKVAELPTRVPARFELALEIDPTDGRDRELLEENAWRLVAPREVAGDALAFRSYVQASGAEFSVAQGIYVEGNTGWFSDRSVGYLASGKPVVVQETGFSRELPVGEGLLSFRTLDDAVAGVESILADYGRHSRAARKLAEEEFDSDDVLSRLLENALA